MGGSAPGEPGLAAARAERLLATATAAFRLGSLVMLAPVPVMQARPRAALTAVVALAGAETLAFAAACLRGRRVRTGWVLADLGTLTTLLVLPALLVSGQSPGYSAALLASVVAGTARWPLWVALLASAPLPLATVGAALLPGSDYPLWNAIPDSLSFPGTVVVAWIVSRLIRHAHQEHDRLRAVAAERAGLLARERERGRQAAALRARLLATLDAVAAEPCLPGILTDQLGREAQWLREVVEHGLPEPTVPLREGLRELTAEKGAAGLTVALVLPDREPALPARCREALLGAAREALTNVAKHAGVGAASVTLRLDHGAVVVEVADRGCGYDPATAVAGTGHTGSIRGRLADVGGTADVSSTPGAGTRVVLRLPEVPR